MNPCALCRCTGSIQPGGYSTVIRTPSFPGNSLRSLERSGVTLASGADDAVATPRLSCAQNSGKIMNSAFIGMAHLSLLIDGNYCGADSIDTRDPITKRSAIK